MLSPNKQIVCFILLLIFAVKILFVIILRELPLVRRLVEAGVSRVLDAAPVALGLAGHPQPIVDYAVAVAAIGAVALFPERQIFQLVPVELDVFPPLQIGEAVQRERDPVVDLRPEVEEGEGDDQGGDERDDDEVFNRPVGIF